MNAQQVTLMAEMICRALGIALTDADPEVRAEAERALAEMKQLPGAVPCAAPAGLPAVAAGVRLQRPTLFRDPIPRLPFPGCRLCIGLSDEIT